jgi:hypothetical protein
MGDGWAWVSLSAHSTDSRLTGSGTCSLARSWTLLAALAEIRADVVIDTYDETDEIGEPAL